MTYLDHVDTTNGQNTVHSWELDVRQRLAWLYGDADERILLTQPDRDAWRRLGLQASKREHLG